MLDWQIEIQKILDHSLPIINPFRPVSSDGIVLYGAGAMGEMALDFLEVISVAPKYIVDRNFKGSLRNIEVISPEDIPVEDLQNFTFVVCIVTSPIGTITDYLNFLGCKDIRHFYDFTEIALKEKLSNGWSCFHVDKNNILDIKNICRSLEHDEMSLAHYLQFLWWRLRRIEYIYDEYPVLSGKKYFRAPCIPELSNHEIFLDGGSHFGVTTQEFIQVVDGHYEHILAFEPDEGNMQKLQSSTKKLDKNKIMFYSDGLADKIEKKCFRDRLGFASKICDNGTATISTVTIDSLHVTPTIIKLHLEGYELKALCGGRKTIKQHRPILMVLADHNDDGLHKIANFLINLESYKLYFYLHDYCGNTAVYYAIPKERCNY